MLSFIKGFGSAFHEAERTETFMPLDNPRRGWYRIYTYRVEEAYEPPVRYENETLALVLLDIGAYKDQELDEVALAKMEQILLDLEALGFDLILRICYDTEGKGMVREPSLFSQVKRHLSQIVPLLLKHRERIFVYQGLLIGNWGEMHGSKYLLPKCLKDLVNQFLEETGRQIPLALRKPVQYRIAFEEGATPQPIGFFNDGIFGSENHLGTFGAMTDGKAAWQELWGIGEELRFMEPFEKCVPCGGEALMPPVKTSAAEYENVLASLHVTYLNSTHDAVLLETWKNTDYMGVSLYDYLGEKLGFRFLVKKVSGRAGKTFDIYVEIENSGFGSLREDVSVQVWASTEERRQEEFLLGTLEGNLKEIMAGQSNTLKGHFSLDRLEGREKLKPLYVYAKAVRNRDGRVIRFAQESTEGFLLLGILKKG